MDQTEARNRLRVHRSFVAGTLVLLGRYPRAGHWPIIQADGGTLSINLEVLPAQPWEVAIKDYSEGVGVLKALVRANVVVTPHRTIGSGHVRIPICRMADWFMLQHAFGVGAG